MDYMCDTLFVHLDDPGQPIQAAVFEVLKRGIQLHPDVIKRKAAANILRSGLAMQRVDQATITIFQPIPAVADTIQTLRQVYDNDEHLPMWEFGLTKAMLVDPSPKIKAGHTLAIVQAALDDYVLSKMALDLSHTLSRIYLVNYGAGWVKPREKKKAVRQASSASHVHISFDA